MREYIIGENQQKKFSFVCDQNSTDRELFLRFYVQAYAALTVHVLIAHANMHVKIECFLQGQGAHAHIHGAYILSDKHVVTIDTLQYHEGAHTSSTLLMKGALRDMAYVQYHGTIHIEKNASGTYASQENKNILLSNGARAVSVPNLQVLNNEVKCFHGSAVGKFDQEHLFYAACRGIDEKRAEEILLNAFFADVVDDELSKRIEYEF